MAEEIEANWTQEEEDEARTIGWHDNRDRLPEGKKFVDPVEFMERNPLYKKVKQLTVSFDQLSSHYQKVSEMEYKKAELEFNVKLETLKKEKVKALDDSDHEKVVQIDEKIRSTEKPSKKKEPPDPIFIEWKENNPWYDKDKFLTFEADDIANKLISSELYGVKLFDEVTDIIKQKYPDKFKNPNREKPSSVESGANIPNKKKTASVKDLVDEEKEAYLSFKKVGMFAKEGAEQRYLNDVIALRG